MNSNKFDANLILKRISFIFVIYVIIFIYNILISTIFDINILDIIQYFTWAGNNLGGDLLNCCKFSYSDVLVTGHPYPPFSYLFFKLCNFLFNINLNDSFSLNFQFFYLVYIFIALMLSLFLFYSIYIKNFDIPKYYVMFLLLFIFFNNWSLGNVMTGNLSLFTLPFCLYFCINVGSDDFIKNILSLTSLLFSFGLKLTPIIYIVLLLYKKKYKLFIITSLLALLVFFIPFLIFNPNHFILNIHFIFMNLIKYSNYNVDKVGGLITLVTLNRFLNSLNIDFNLIVLISKVLSKILFVILLLCGIKKDFRKQILIITISLAMIGPAYPHYLIYFLIPFFMYLFYTERYNIFDKINLILLLAIFLPYKSFLIPTFLGIDENILRSVISDLCINILCICVIIETIYDYHKNKIYKSY